MHSFSSINEILNKHSEDEIYFFLSKRNKVTYSFFKGSNTHLKIFNYSLSFFEKLNIIIFFLFNNINTVYILAPKNLYFYLPLFFRKTKFFALCVNSSNNKFRPALFFRKFLTYYLVNNRTLKGKREPLKDLQLRLINYGNQIKSNNKLNLNIVLNKTNNFKTPKNYIFFHFKKIRFDKLHWNIEKTFNFIGKLSEISDILIATDIEGNDYINQFKEKFNYYDYENNIYKNRNLKITYLHNLKDLDLFNVIVKSRKTIATHGMITAISSFFNVPTLDIFSIGNPDKPDKQSTLNISREFSPFNKDYIRVVPSKDFNKTVNKILFFSKYA